MVEPDTIRADGLVKLYRAAAGNVLALRGLSLSVSAGELTCVVGPSGSGKSTLLACLAGRERPSAGRLTALGVDLHNAPPRRVARYRAHSIGIVHQHYFRALSPDMTMLDAVGLRAGLIGWPAKLRRSRAAALLEEAGLSSRLTARRHELSGGEQQRAAVCAAILTRPRLLLADEPTGELDADNSARVLELIRRLAQANATTVVLVSHDPAAAAIADRILTLRDGWFVTERRAPDGEELTVVDSGGFLRLEPHLQTDAGIGDRARQAGGNGQVTLTGDGTVPIGAPDAGGTHVPPGRSSERPEGAGQSPVTVERATRTYGAGNTTVTAVDGVSAAFAAGQFHVLTGPSGSGKTTLLHLVAGLERPDSGTIVVLDHDLTALSRADLARFRRRQVAMIAQTPALVSFLTATENVLLAATLHGIDPKQATAFAQETLRDVGLEPRADYRVDALSKGERQRVALARALVSKPALLLADEPTANLDQDNAVTMARMLARIAHERHTTVICATHDPMVIEHADRVSALESGRLTCERPGTGLADSEVRDAGP